MDDFINAIESALGSGNWFAALFIALCIPDICGYLETPEDGKRARYERWFDRYMLPRYTRDLFFGPHVFLSASDCYALRCSLLHTGSDSIVEQCARDVLTQFQFVAPSRNLLHCNQSGGLLQLQIDFFCAEIVAGIRQWLLDVQGNPDISARIGDRMKVYTPPV